MLPEAHGSHGQLPVTPLEGTGESGHRARHPGCVPKSEKLSQEAAERGCLRGRPLLRNRVPRRARLRPASGLGRWLRATVGATVRGAAGRGQSSRQTVTFLGRLSCNTFPGRRKEVEAFVLKRPPRQNRGGPRGLVRGPAQGAARLISPG